MPRTVDQTGTLFQGLIDSLPDTARERLVEASAQLQDIWENFVPARVKEAYAHLPEVGEGVESFMAVSPVGVVNRSVKASRKALRGMRKHARPPRPVDPLDININERNILQHAPAEYDFDDVIRTGRIVPFSEPAGSPSRQYPTVSLGRDKRPFEGRTTQIIFDRDTLRKNTDLEPYNWYGHARAPDAPATLDTAHMMAKETKLILKKTQKDIHRLKSKIKTIEADAAKRYPNKDWKRLDTPLTHKWREQQLFLEYAQERLDETNRALLNTSVKHGQEFEERTRKPLSIALAKQINVDDPTYSPIGAYELAERARKNGFKGPFTWMGTRMDKIIDLPEGERKAKLLDLQKKYFKDTRARSEKTLFKQAEQDVVHTHAKFLKIKNLFKKNPDDPALATNFAEAEYQYKKAKEQLEYIKTPAGMKVFLDDFMEASFGYDKAKDLLSKYE